MSIQSRQMKKQGKINTQMALYYLESLYGVSVPFQENERKKFIKRMKEEVQCKKEGHFWYFSISSLSLFADIIKREVQE